VNSKTVELMETMVSSGSRPTARRKGKGARPFLNSSSSAIDEKVTLGPPSGASMSW
jgi:hypothetical protein